jgi:hypothetical protein
MNSCEEKIWKTAQRFHWLGATNLKSDLEKEKCHAKPQSRQDASKK